MFILQALPLFAGIGLFLYGMSVLGANLEKIAGARMEQMLGKLTDSKTKGVLFGMTVTGVIQSSSATTIMAIGLLNAGVFKLVQAVPVIMGANIGTTVTGQILRLGDLGETSFLLYLLKPSSFGPLLIGAGAALDLFSKRQKSKNIGIVMLGLGMIFFGMATMESTLSPLKEQAWFQDVFFIFENPLLGILLGTLMTAVLQSSSASVGILQALTSTGAITFSTAVPIILGQNVGKCITVVLASIGSRKQARRAVFIDVFCNTLGMVFFFLVIYSYQALVGFPFWDSAMTRGNIADFHTLFNILTTLFLLPFVDKLIFIAKKLIKDKENSYREDVLDSLDDLLLKTPVLAMEQSRKAVHAMAGLAASNFNLAAELLLSYGQEKRNEISENEELLDRYEDTLAGYIVKITGNDLKESDAQLATEMLYDVGDFERIGDHCMNIAEVAQFNFENKIQFSPLAIQELRIFGGAVTEVLKLTMDAYEKRELVDTLKIEPLEQVIDKLQYTLKERHISRLRDGVCDVQAGISFLELLGNFERISDHCSNIALYIIRSKQQNYNSFDPHAYLDMVHQKPTEEYLANYHYFCDKYKVESQIS